VHPGTQLNRAFWGVQAQVYGDVCLCPATWSARWHRERAPIAIRCSLICRATVRP
jgi:hypothetical protein